MDVALLGKNGVVGIDDETNKIECISFNRIKGGKPFDVNQKWFSDMIERISKIN